MRHQCAACLLLPVTFGYCVTRERKIYFRSCAPPPRRIKENMKERHRRWIAIRRASEIKIWIDLSSLFLLSRKVKMARVEFCAAN